MSFRLLVAALTCCFASTVLAGAATGAPPPPDFGPNVKIFDPSMTTSQIKAVVDDIANQQVSNEFGTQRYALLFKPGSYGSPADPLNFQVGYYTDVARLRRAPRDAPPTGARAERNTAP